MVVAVATSSVVFCVVLFLIMIIELLGFLIAYIVMKYKVLLCIVYTNLFRLIVDSEGWEKLGLYEYYRAKNAARKKKEDDILEGLRERSKSPSPVICFRSRSRSPPKKRYRRYCGTVTYVDWKVCNVFFKTLS
jgi:hypothetical protein